MTNNEQTPFNVLLLGAGRINFGTTEGPWNHSRRLEQKLGPRLNVVGLIDINTEHAENILAMKRADDSVQAGYKNTKVFTGIPQAAAALQGGDTPHLIINGIQGSGRGTTIHGSDTDIQFAKHFPSSAQFIEKPISAGSFEELDKVQKVLDGKIISVGYMLRYLKAVREMKKIIEENNLTVMATQATYIMAYKYAGETSKTIGYWDLNNELGPIVGQGTHLVDLSRYFAPPPIHDSVHVHTVEPTDKAGFLSQLKFDEPGLVPAERRIPRITNAIWRWEGGATGSLLHAVSLHEGDYDCELVILADGWKLRLVDPYSTAPKLYVRRPGTTEETRTVFTDDDYYYSEISAIIDVIEGKADRSVILSPYDDSMDTYKFTWAIRLAGEEAARQRKKRPA